MDAPILFTAVSLFYPQRLTVVLYSIYMHRSYISKVLSKPWSTQAMAIVTPFTSISLGTEGSSISSPVGDHSAVLMNTDKCKRQREGVSVGMEEK